LVIYEGSKMDELTGHGEVINLIDVVVENARLRRAVVALADNMMVARDTHEESMAWAEFRVALDENRVEAVS